MTTPQPVRFPETWSASWFRDFYNEVLARPVTTTDGGVSSAQVVAAIAAALAVHNADPDAHPGLQGVDEAYVFFVGGG